jgi:hypothetical protein
MGTVFNWDKYYSTASWSEVRENSSLLLSERLPSIIHEKQQLAYFSSIDLDCSLNDQKSLESYLGSIKEVFQREVESKNYYKAACAESDFHQAQDILVNLGFPSNDTLSK